MAASVWHLPPTVYLSLRAAMNTNCRTLGDASTWAADATTWLTDEIPGRHRMMSKWGYTSLTDEIPGRHRMTSKWGYISLTDEMPS